MPDVATAQDYYPFGMLLSEGRSLRLRLPTTGMGLMDKRKLMRFQVRGIITVSSIVYMMHVQVASFPLIRLRNRILGVLLMPLLKMM